VHRVPDLVLFVAVPRVTVAVVVVGGGVPVLVRGVAVLGVIVAVVLVVVVLRVFVAVVVIGVRGSCNLKFTGLTQNLGQL
jgi:hypothetical protein